MSRAITSRPANLLSGDFSSEQLTDIFLNAELQLLAFHLLDLLIVELVPVASAGVFHVGDVVTRVGADAPVDQHGAQLVHAALVWNSVPNTWNMKD